MLASLLAWLVAHCAPAAFAQAIAVEAVPWASRDLEIPYRWTGSTAAARSVVLYYSADRGRSWLTAGTAAPHVRSFRFRAPADGEYCFAIRTYDHAGRAAPAGPLGAEMRVLVDTTGPRLDRLEADLDDRTLRVSLVVEDPATADPDGIRIYAQADGRPGWMPVPIDEARPTADGRSLRVTGRWLAPPGTKSVAVRASVEDRAGNRAEEETVATAEAAAPAPLVASAPAAAQPAWGRLASSSYGAIDPFAEAERRHPAPRRVETPAPASTPWPAEQAKSKPLVASRPPEVDPFRSASFRAGSFDSATTLPADIPRRLVNSTEFEFDYELDETGRWGVAKVELWGTPDGGRSWRRFAIDSDRESPIHVSAPGEGEYGFRLVVESIGGLEAPKPRPGDQPETLVEVDLQAPRAALRGTRQGDGYLADQLSIEWRVDDEHLADRPIDLFYSNRPTGPWVPIATNLPNSGRHDWRLQRHLPRQMFLRLEARDEAGNTTATTTPEALTVEVPTASGSLRGVRPAG